jgi:O-antigen/teichoic acid export membrane protein
MTQPSSNATVEYARPSTPTPSSEGFGVRSARGGLYLTAMTIASGFLNFGTNILLAWLLVPGDFGIAMTAASVAALVQVLRDAGAPTLLIQRQHEFDRIAGSVFWLTLSAAMICAVFVAVAAPFVARSQQQPILIPVLLLTALRFPVGALGTVSQGRLTIDLRWLALAAATFLQPLVTSVLAVLMAWRGYGVYSLIVPAIFADAARGAALWWLTRLHAPLRPHWLIISSIIGSSIFIILTNFTMVARGVGDYLVLSFTQSKYNAGLYYYGFTMCAGLMKMTLGTLPNVLTPVLSKVQHDEQRHADMLTRATHTFAILGTLPIAMQGVLAWPLFRLFLDPKWAPSATIFAIISLASLLIFVNNVFSQGLWASGCFRQSFAYSSVFTIVVLALFLLGSLSGGIFGVAWAQVLAGAIDITVYPLLALRWLKVPWRPVMLPLWKPLVAVLPTTVAALIAHHVLPVSRTYDLLRVLMVGVIGTAGYVTVLLLIWRPQALEVWKTIMGALPARVRQLIPPSLMP